MMLSFQVFFCLPSLLPPSTVSRKMVLARRWTGDMSIPRQFASLCDGQEVFVWSDCLLDLGTFHSNVESLFYSVVSQTNQLSRDRNLHGLGMSLARTASLKPSFRAPWRMGDAVVGWEDARWTTLKNGHPCLCQNCSQWPLAGQTGRESLLNHLSCPLDDPIGQGTELNCSQPSKVSKMRFTRWIMPTN